MEEMTITFQFKILIIYLGSRANVWPMRGPPGFGTLRVLDKVVTSAQTCVTLRARELRNADTYFESDDD